MGRGYEWNGCNWWIGGGFVFVELRVGWDGEGGGGGLGCGGEGRGGGGDLSRGGGREEGG